MEKEKEGGREAERYIEGERDKEGTKVREREL